MEETKSRLLQTACEMFARYGIDGVSTRDLSRKAKVNLCSISYYFGTKQKLYDAVLEGIADSILIHFIHPVREKIKNIGPQIPPREELKLLFAGFFEFLNGENISEFQTELLVKEILKPAAVYDRFYSIVFEPLHKHAADLIASDLGLPADHHKPLLLAHTLFGQIVMFRIHKVLLMRRMGIENYTPELMTEIREILSQNCDAVLERAREV